jgi:hypothetical protein
VSQQLDQRARDDAQRAREIYSAFRLNLRESLDVLHRAEEEEAAKLFSDDQQRQRRRDIDAMTRRLDELADEESRELEAISARYADVKPHVSAAAVLFALTASDASEWGH